MVKWNALISLTLQMHKRQMACLLVCVVVDYAICLRIALNTILYSFVICQTILRHMLKMTNSFVADGRDWNKTVSFVMFIAYSNISYYSLCNCSFI